MRKRVLIPGAAIGGLAIYLASQFLSFNIGDISIPTSSDMVSMQPQSASTGFPDTSAIVDEEPADSGGTESLSDEIPEVLVLIDVLIDGDQFFIARVTNASDLKPTETLSDVSRQPVTANEIVAQVSTAQGDKSGTRVRISRTSEAIASAETELIDALTAAGIDADEIDRRSRLADPQG